MWSPTCMQGSRPRASGRGAEITHWNGMPIERAVDLNAARFAGSNEAARHARGVESLTIRPLRIHLPPDEEWVTRELRRYRRRGRELREPWQVVDNLPPLRRCRRGQPAAADRPRPGRRRGEPGAATAVRAAAVAQELAPSARAAAVPGRAATRILPTTMPQVFRARSVTTSSGTFGHMRIFTFSVDDPDAFVTEFVRLIEQLPQNGLIVDVRGNGGGLIFASEFTLQTLTPRPIAPEPVQFINTPLNLQICRQAQGQPGRHRPGPMVPVDGSGGRDGRVVLQRVPDHRPPPGERDRPALSRSRRARHRCSLLLRDRHLRRRLPGPRHRPGPRRRRDTGAGGANVWTHACSSSCWSCPTPDASTPYKRCAGRGHSGGHAPHAARRVAGRYAGRGPWRQADKRHHLTRNDVLGDNADLLDHAASSWPRCPCTSWSWGPTGTAAEIFASTWR